MSEVRKTAKFAAIYAVGMILERMASFIMLPIYTNYLTTADYGTIELLMMTVDIFSMVAGVGISMAIFRFYYKYKEPEKRNLVMSTAVILLIGFYFIFSLVGELFSGQLADIVLTGGAENKKYFRIVFITFFLQAFILLPLIFIRAQQKPLLFVGVSLSKLIVQLGLNIWFVVFLRMGVLGVLYSTLITIGFFGLGLTIYTFKKVGIGFSKDIGKNIILYGAPFILSNVGDFVLTFSDRFFLKTYAGLDVVGVYSLGYKIGFVLWALAVMPINNTWGPKRFEIAEQKDAGEINQRVFFLFNLVIITVGLGLSLFCLDLFRIMSAPEFWAAYKIVPLVVLAYLVQAWTSFGNFGIHYSEKTKYIAYSTLASAVLIVGLNFLLIPILHGYGAAIATVLAFLLRFIIVYKKAQSFYRLPLKWGQVLFMLAAAGSCYGLSRLFFQDNLILSIALNVGLYLLFFLSLWILPIFNKSEKQMMVRFLRNPRAALKGN